MFFRLSIILGMYILFLPVHLIGGETPYLIALQPAQVQESWRKVELLMKENSKLKQPMPEPYLARAELWTIAGNHEEAIEDYLEATNLTLASKPTVADQARILILLKSSLKRLAEQPKPMYPQKSRDVFRAGFRLFMKARHEEAAPLFAEATRLNSSDAVYRVVRALNCKKIGQLDKAKQQLSAASSILRHPYFSILELEDFHFRLERIQYGDRRWITQGMMHSGLNGHTTAQEASRLVSQIEISVQSVGINDEK